MRAHGTHACYVWGPEPGAGDGCRCDPCREANRVYEKERSRRAAPAYVGAANARHHVQWLSEQGVGLKQIVKVSGVSQGALWKLMYGKDGKRSKRIRKATEDAILAVTPADAADGAKLPAAPTWAHVATLVERGWTKVAIARAIGQNSPGLQLGDEYVSARNARAVAALLDEPVPPGRSRHGLHHVEQPAEPEPTASQAPRFHEPPPPTIDPAIFDLPWRRQAACRLLPADQRWIFWPGQGDTEAVAAAKAVCATCPVADECLDFALDTDEKHGIWGGKSERERRSIRSTRRAA